jgi:hypothetical protein
MQVFLIIRRDVVDEVPVRKWGFSMGQNPYCLQQNNRTATKPPIVCNRTATPTSGCA